eukprot:12902144-Prorocentrum_lima.AAC.1
MADDIQDADEGGQAAPPKVQKWRLAAAACGKVGALFLSPLAEQEAFAKVSHMELAAFGAWQSKRTDPAPGIEARWEELDVDKKSSWVPEDPRDVLAKEAEWAPVLRCFGEQDR